MTASKRSTRSGFILADTLGGLGVLAAGLAAFLACMSQSHALIRRAEAAEAARAEITLRMALPAAGPRPVVLGWVVSQPRPGPQRLADVGSGLCEVTAETRDREKRVWRARTVRFCLTGGEGAS